jgi:hypothetical protein
VREQSVRWAIDNNGAISRPVRRVPMAFLALWLIVAFTAASALAAEPEYTLTAEQFNSSVFYGRTAPGQQRVAATAIFHQEIRKLDATYSLAPVQVKSLELAGGLDIDAWLERVATVRTRFADQPLIRKELAEARRLMDELRAAPQAMFQVADSHFQTTLNETLTAEQRKQAAARAEAARIQPAVQNVAVFRGDAAPFIVNAENDRRVVINSQQFDRSVFEGLTSEKQVRQTLAAVLEKELAPFTAACALTDRQQRKLRLAGRGDVQAWLDRVVEVREKYTTAPISMDEYQIYRTQLEMLRARKQSGLFGDGSLFRKTLAGTLDDAQEARFTEFERQQRTAQFDAFVRSWEQKPIGIKLDDAQRQKLVLLFLDHPGMPQSWGPYTHWIGLLQVDKHAQEIKPLLEPWQWELLQKQVAQARQVEPQLRAFGVWPLPANRDATED